LKLTLIPRHKQPVMISGPVKPGTKIPKPSASMNVPRRGVTYTRQFYNPTSEPFCADVAREWADLLIKDGDVVLVDPEDAKEIRAGWAAGEADAAAEALAKKEETEAKAKADTEARQLALKAFVAGRIAAGKTDGNAEAKAKAEKAAAAKVVAKAKAEAEAEAKVPDPSPADPPVPPKGGGKK
jgi:hypothetical protein